MEFTNTFHVPSDVDTTFATLTDLQRVAPCLPGATLESVEGDTYTGEVKVKVGPIAMTYRGTARLTEADPATRTARIEASGNEARGSGTARADVVATLTAEGTGTMVHVVTDLTISGRAAQFGRGVMAEVGTRIIDTFADRLRDMIVTDDAHRVAGSTPSEVATGTADRAGEALDLMDVAGAAAAKRLVPLLAAIVVVVALVVWLRGR
jgi:carbon monoxide dehydrogenase subunit G